jgi:hypothetical protein
MLTFCRIRNNEVEGIWRRKGRAWMIRKIKCYICVEGKKNKERERKKSGRKNKCAR